MNRRTKSDNKRAVRKRPRPPRRMPDDDWFEFDDSDSLYELDNCFGSDDDETTDITRGVRGARRMSTMRAIENVLEDRALRRALEDFPDFRTLH